MPPALTEIVVESGRDLVGLDVVVAEVLECAEELEVVVAGEM